jgi:hypothetical protein
MVALGMRIQNWAQTIPYRISFVGQADRRLQNDMLDPLKKPHRLERLEAAFHPFDISVVRAALFELLAMGECVAPNIDTQPPGLHFSSGQFLEAPGFRDAGWDSMAEYRNAGPCGED